MHHLYPQSCDHQTFFAASSNSQRCHIATTFCSEDYDFVNFFAITFCLLQSSFYATLLCLLLILVIFRFISAVVEEYLAPSIAYISEHLNLPEALAAVTLLALANGAGDVITAIVASGTPDGLSYNIGAIYGAGLFVTTIIVAQAINNSKNDIIVDPNTIWRDVGFYILSTLLIIVFAILGELTFLSGILLLLLYVAMVSLVYYQERSKGRIGPQGQEEEEEEEDEEKKKKNEHEKAQDMNDKDLIHLPAIKTREEKQAYPKKWRSKAITPISHRHTFKTAHCYRNKKDEAFASKVSINSDADDENQERDIDFEFKLL